MSVHILNHFRKLGSFRKWENGMNINPEDETSYTTQNKEAFLKNVENEYWAKHRLVSVVEPQKVSGQQSLHLCNSFRISSLFF